MTELTELFKAFATRPELALVALMFVLVAYGVQKLLMPDFAFSVNILKILMKILRVLQAI